LRIAQKIKWLMVFCCCLLFTPSFSMAESDAAPGSQIEKESYSIGYQIGISMKSDSIEVNMDRLEQGLKDAIGDKTPQLSKEEMRDLIVKRRELARQQQMRKIQEQIVVNAKESQAFLEKNKTKEGVHTTASGLQYKVLKEGTGPIPQPEDFVKVDYRGTFIDGEEFDSSYAKGEPIRIQADGVIKGWTEALAMMKTGSKWQLFVPPALAYGRGGAPGRIPPNKVLVFEMELLGIEKTDETTQSSSAPPAQPAAVKKMSLKGEIGKTPNAYVIRSKKGDVLSTIYTVLNPNPKILDTFVNSEKNAQIEVRIMSGDNVEIDTINGEPYKP